MKVPLTRGLFAIIDDEDWPLVSKYKWWAHATATGIVAQRHLRTERVGAITRRTSQNMEVLLMGRRSGFTIDHVNRNPLDNRRENLRWATRSQNMANRGMPNKSGFRGIRPKNRSSWQARIRFQGHNVYLGTFKTKQEAAEAFRAAARAVFGDFACFDVKPRKKRS